MTETTVVLAPNPSVYTGPGTNTYLVGDGAELLCIDPGPDDDQHLRAVLAEATRRGGRITRIALTHSHPDHRPLAVRLRAETGATVHCFDISAGGDGAEPLVDGDHIAVGDVDLVAVHTPGHARDHLCFHDARHAALYTGDHILSGMSSFVDPDDGDMSQYMASLDRVLRLQPQVIHPGHGPMVENGTELIRKYIAHRLEREQQIIATARGRGPTAPMELVEVIYAAYPQALHPLAARSVQAHLDKLVREGRATRTAVNDEPRYAIP